MAEYIHCAGILSQCVVTASQVEVGLGVLVRLGDQLNQHIGRVAVFAPTAELYSVFE
jgi:hypothetical protein